MSDYPYCPLCKGWVIDEKKHTVVFAFPDRPKPKPNEVKTETGEEK